MPLLSQDLINASPLNLYIITCDLEIIDLHFRKVKEKLLAVLCIRRYLIMPLARLVSSRLVSRFECPLYQSNSRCNDDQKSIPILQWLFLKTSWWIGTVFSQYLGPIFLTPLLAHLFVFTFLNRGIGYVRDLLSWFFSFFFESSLHSELSHFLAILMILLNCIVLNFIECHFKHAMFSVYHIIYYPFVLDFSGCRFMNMMLMLICIICIIRFTKFYTCFLVFYRFRIGAHIAHVVAYVNVFLIVWQ